MEILRQNGFALTIVVGEGFGGEQRTTIISTIKRKHVKVFKQLVFNSDPGVVMTIPYTQQINGALFLGLAK